MDKPAAAFIRIPTRIGLVGNAVCMGGEHVCVEGLKIVGHVTAEGLVEVNGQIKGELHCTSLVISRKAHVAGTIQAEKVVVDGTVEGPIQGGDVILKSQAHVVGDIHHQSLAIERGAFFDGRSVQGNVQRLEEPEMNPQGQLQKLARPSPAGLSGLNRWTRIRRGVAILSCPQRKDRAN